MGWYLLREKEKILRIIEHLISKRTEITIRIKGEKTIYFSRVIGIVPESNCGDHSKASDQKMEMLIEKLIPERGNKLIRQFPEIGIEFPTNEYACRCHSKYASFDSGYPYHGLTMTFPAFVELEEKRAEQRFAFQSEEFISAVFKIPVEGDDNQIYELDIINWSGHGLALLVTEKDFDLIERLRPIHKIPEITLFAASAMMTVDGTLRHINKIEGGKYRGDYLLGLELNTSIERTVMNLFTEPSTS